MLLGIKLKANPTQSQKQILSQWMGCARFIWNAKCDEERYHTIFARKYYPIGTYAPIDQKTAHFKSKELTPWLYDCPSQIIRNAAVNWYETYLKFIKGQCGKPRRKPKTDQGSIHLTRELFNFEIGKDKVRRLFIGSKKNNIGYLSLKVHRTFKLPNSLYIRKQCGQYFVSFCYEKKVGDQPLLQEHFAYLKGSSPAYLNEHMIGIDRGVAVPVQAGQCAFDFNAGQKNNKAKAERYIKRLQRRLAKQTNKHSHRRTKTKQRIAKNYAKLRHIRHDFCHQTSRALINSQKKIFIFEDLKTTQMTKAAKAKQAANGRYLPNRARQKSGLNKAILDIGWYQLETYTQYKAYLAGKAVFKINAAYTSQECANCSHIHPNNRKSQALFQCGNCGHIDHADSNASQVIKQRAINMILDTGTVLSERGVITLKDTGRGAESQPIKPKCLRASGDETSKKKRTAAINIAA